MNNLSNIGVAAMMTIALACGKATPASHFGGQLQDPDEDGSDAIELGEMHSYKNLHLYALIANEEFIKSRAKTANYITLKEATQLKKVVITELGRQDGTTENQSNIRQLLDEAEVNKLFIENVSLDTLLILNGEIVKGGKQDRIIAEDLVLPPNSGKVDISVFCVEQGRWEGESAFFMVMEDNLSHPKLREKSKVDNDQRKVWDEVHETLTDLDVESSTSTVLDLKQDAGYASQLEGYKLQFAELFDEQNVIGVIAVSGGEIIGADLFATNKLFKKHYANLVQSYATEAITNTGDDTVSRKQVKGYLKRILREQEFLLKKGEEYVPHISSFRDKRPD